MKEIEALLSNLSIDPENVEDMCISIDIESIEQESEKEAQRMCKELQDYYFDEDFINSRPTLVSRIRQEIYALYVLLKMRKSDEIIHDLNIKSIASNPTNASLYKALNQTQSSILSISRQIDEKVKDIQNILKEKQLSFDFKEEYNNESSQTTYRGSKSFIESMKKEINSNE